MYGHKFIASVTNLRTGDKILAVDIDGGTTDVVVQGRANNASNLKVAGGFAKLGRLVRWYVR
jgi:hypothetical protein